MKPKAMDSVRGAHAHVSRGPRQSSCPYNRARSAWSYPICARGAVWGFPGHDLEDRERPTGSDPGGHRETGRRSLFSRDVLLPGCGLSAAPGHVLPEARDWAQPADRQVIAGEAQHFLAAILASL